MVIVAFIAFFSPGLIYLFIHEPIGDLYGVTVEEITLINKWSNKSFQTNCEKIIREKHPIFPLAVRVKNEIEFDFFQKVNAQDVYFQNGVFFRMRSPDFKEKDDFIGRDSIDQQVAQLKRIIDVLKMPIYIVIAPNKRRLFNDKLNAVNRDKQESKTNYYWFKNAFRKHNLPCLDVNDWFIKLQKKSAYPLMSKYGVHWTQYGAYLAFDSLIRRYNYEQKKQFTTVNLNINKEVEYDVNDIDLLNLSNLFFQRKDGAIRAFKFQSKGNKKMNPFVLGDSFYHAVLWTKMSQHLFSTNTVFYYYFNTRICQNLQESPRKMWRVRDDLRRSDCIILLIDVQNLTRFGFGFIAEMSNY